MSPRLSQVSVSLRRVSIIPSPNQICPICSVSKPASATTRRKRPRIIPLRKDRQCVRRQSSQANLSSTHGDSPFNSKEARLQLREALTELQKHAASYVNISRLQLALRGLDQPAGQETIRIAILGLADGGTSLRVAKDLVRGVIADPLKQEEEWERTLVDPDSMNKSVLLKIGEAGGGQIRKSRLLQEINMSWPKMNENNLEILVLEADLPPAGTTLGEKMAFTESLVVPRMEIPTSSTGRTTPVTTPVHKVLAVGHGIEGVVSLIQIHSDKIIINAAASIAMDDSQDGDILGIQAVDTAKALRAIGIFRKDVRNALKYEQDWYESRVNIVSEWITAGTSTTDGAMKSPVRSLIESLLDNTLTAVEVTRSAQLQARISAKISASDLESLHVGLSQWAEVAHTELRDQLDIAFTGQRWRKLGWWKLFWRVDDVSMITSDMLNQRFLTNAEKEAIFLAGRFQQSKIVGDQPLVFGPQAYKYEQEPIGPGPPPPTIQGLIEVPNDEAPTKSEPKSWPLEIPATRTLLSIETIPALQALGQKLVFQTLTTSTFASALSGLIYVSDLTTSIYESGAVAALVIVWSLRRMQGKWETARKFWEGEVREEGRRAIRGTENALLEVLQQKYEPLEGAEEQDDAIRVVEKAQEVLRSCK